jgi:hypothetical protein
MTWMIQGPNAPTEAKRPSAEILEALSNIEQLSDRYALAGTLAAQGYTVDVPIDVWCWNEEAVMRNRREAGYTWVPCAGMPPVNIVPGLEVPGMTKYDPAKPPIGAILVPPQ